MSSPSSVLVYFWHLSSCFAVVRGVRNVPLLLHPGTVCFFLPGAIWLTTCLVCVIQRVHFNICQLSTSHGLSVHYVWNSVIALLASVSLFVVSCPCALPFLRSSDAELSRLQLLQLYKLVGLCQLVLVHRYQYADERWISQVTISLFAYP